MNATMPVPPAAVPALPAAPAVPHAVVPAGQVAGQVAGQAAAPAAQSPGLLEGAGSTLSSWAGYFEALAVLFFILAVLWLLLRFMRRRGGGFLTGGGPVMRVEQRLALGPKKWVMVARILDRRLVLGVTDHQITMLTELDADERPASEPKSSFASVLKGVKPPADPGGA